ncbi:hypothetical protein AB0J35_21610 [Nonomuraea angiospora]|uniref:hypothetical protein n=1 Tax=Nonomuraea angiospora TaxID=46172 RepID=UPI00341FE256
MTSPWQQRYDVGIKHEQYVLAELGKRGWDVAPAGQGTLPHALRQALSRTTSALRHFPDILAARAGNVVAIDAKARMPASRSRRYAISRDCLEAGLSFLALYRPIPLYYVFGDLGVTTPAEVIAYRSIAQPHPSGAYYLVDQCRTHPFDEVFGKLLAMTAA